MTVELHLPDLPEVPISIGTQPGSPNYAAVPWPLRLRDALASYLPLVLMALLALATWWLVKNSPQPPGATVARVVGNEPDYTMQQFSLDRFTAAGPLRARIEGAEMRHFPATDRIEIDEPRIRAIGADGRVTLAQARRAIGNGDGSEMQLLGDARVTGDDGKGDTVVLESDFLHAFLITEQVRTHLPVQVQTAGMRIQAAGLQYDNVSGLIELVGPMRAVLQARAPRP